MTTQICIWISQKNLYLKKYFKTQLFVIGTLFLNPWRFFNWLHDLTTGITPNLIKGTNYNIGRKAIPLKIVFPKFIDREKSPCKKKLRRTGSMNMIFFLLKFKKNRILFSIL